MWTFTGDSFVGEKTTEELGMSQPNITDGGLQVGQMTFTQVFQDAASVVRLNEGDAFITYRNGSKFWHGWVSRVRVGNTNDDGFALQVTVSDVMWWLNKVMLSGEARGSDGGALRERAGFGFGEGDLRNHIIALIDRMKTLGVPIDVGGISSMFDVPQVTVKQASGLEALGILMRFIPDAMLWINHGAAVPTINIKRKQYAGTKVFSNNDTSNDNAALHSWSAEALWTLEARQVKVPFVKRNTNGLTVYDEQVAGVETLGQRLIFPVSGIELDTYLPYDYNDSFTAETESTSDIGTVALALGMFDAAKTNGLTNQLTFGARAWTFYLSANLTSPQTYNVPSAVYTTAEGQSVDMTGKYILKGETPPAWAQEVHGLQQVSVRVRYSYLHNTQDANDPNTVIDPPTWNTDLPGVGEFAQGYTAGSPWYYTRLYGGEIAFSIWVIDQEYSTATDLFKPGDYDYFKPPANFAQNFLDTQNFVPYGGTFNFCNENVGEIEYRGHLFNLTDSLAEHATMNAMVQERILNLAQGITTITLGVPQRFRYQDLLTRNSRTASDNIFWITGTGYSLEDDGSGGVPTSGSSGGSTSVDNGTGNTTSIGIGGSGEDSDLVEDQNDSEHPLHGSIDYQHSQVKASDSNHSLSRVYSKVLSGSFTLNNVPGGHQVVLTVNYGAGNFTKTITNYDADGTSKVMDGVYSGVQINNVISKSVPITYEDRTETVDFGYTVSMRLEKWRGGLQTISEYSKSGTFELSGAIGGANVQGESGFTIQVDTGAFANYEG